MAARKTYAQALEQGAKLRAQAVLTDPNSHFPYKREAVQDILEEDPPMGPGNPEGEDGTQDTTRTVADYMTADIADASEEYIAAQEAYLRSPDEETRAEYDAARDRLQAARLDHRGNRGSSFTVGAAARRAG